MSDEQKTTTDVEQPEGEAAEETEQPAKPAPKPATKPAAKPVAKAAPAEPATDDASASARTGRSLPGMDLAKARIALARVLWAVCVLFALVLASAVLMIALEANPANDLVKIVIERADDVDLGFFDLSNPIKDFDTELSETEDTKTALFNYGIAAIVWLLLGRIVDRLVRP